MKAILLILATILTICYISYQSPSTTTKFLKTGKKLETIGQTITQQGLVLADTLQSVVIPKE